MYGMTETTGTIVALPPEDHVDGLEPAQELQVDPITPDQEVSALDQRVAQVAGQEGVFEVGLVVWARGEQDHPGIVAVVRRDCLERVADGLEERGEPLDLAVAEHVGQHP